MLTLYSPKIDSLPYVHDTHNVTLRANGREAPAEPGYILGFKEMALVDSKDPNAKPLPIAKMMVHHFLYFAPGRVNDAPGSCWRGSGFIGGRGEEHPLGRMMKGIPKPFRDRYGIANRTADGAAPGLAPDRDGDEPLQAAEELLRPHQDPLHDRAARALAAARDRRLQPGSQRDVLRRRRRRRARLRATSTRAPGPRPSTAASSPRSRTSTAAASTSCSRARRATGGSSRRPSTTAARATRTTRSGRSCTSPGRSGTAPTPRRPASRSPRARCCRRAAVHDNHNLHVASMGFWITMFVRDDSVQRCGPLPDDIVEINRPKRFDRTPDHDLVVPQLARPRGRSARSTAARSRSATTSSGRRGSPRASGRRSRGASTAQLPHTVTVANGPRGFSSIYWGQTAGTYSVTPQCPAPTSSPAWCTRRGMAQTLVVK